MELDRQHAGSRRLPYYVCKRVTLGRLANGQSYNFSVIKRLRRLPLIAS